MNYLRAQHEQVPLPNSNIPIFQKEMSLVTIYYEEKLADLPASSNNDVHPEAPMRVLSPYQPIHLNLPLDIEILGPMPDEPPTTTVMIYSFSLPKC